jgi:hypothetical protein
MARRPSDSRAKRRIKVEGKSVSPQHRALASGWIAVAALAIAQRLVAAPWLIHKLTDPVGLAIGAMVAARLRAGTAKIILGGLAVSQGTEFLMDLASGTPAIHGSGAHIALMIAGVAGVAIGGSLWGRATGAKPNAPKTTERSVPEDDAPISPSVGPTSADADHRFMESLRLRRNAYLTRLQLG